VTLGIGALSQLYVGYRPIDDLARRGAATIHDDRGQGLLADAFPASETFLRERF
jgi:hypothetical protein